MNEVRIYNPDGTLKRIISPQKLATMNTNVMRKKKTDTIKSPPVKRVDYTPMKDGTQ